MERVDVEAIHAARRFVLASTGTVLHDLLLRTHGRLAEDGPYAPEPRAMGRRALRNACLAYLGATGSDEAMALAEAQFDAARNMTDRLSALAVLNDFDRPERTAALGRFQARWQEDGLVLDKWFALQAMSCLPGTLDRVEALSQHPDFDLRNPNRARALIGTFSQANPLHFHDRSGRGYRFLADKVLALDPLNPQVSARLIQPLGQWRRYDTARQGLMRRELERVLAAPELSKNTFEMASKSLN
jgi:aminopeptidase N